MSVEEYRDNLELILSAARLVSIVDVPKMLADIAHADTVGPFLDPTLWQANHHKMEEDRELLKAALPLWKQAIKYMAKEEKP